VRVAREARVLIEHLLEAAVLLRLRTLGMREQAALHRDGLLRLRLGRGGLAARGAQVMLADLLLLGLLRRLGLAGAGTLEGALADARCLGGLRVLRVGADDIRVGLR